MAVMFILTRMKLALKLQQLLGESSYNSFKYANFPLEKLVGMKENEFSNRKKLEQNIALWLTIIGVPFGVSVGLFSWMGLSLKQWLPVSLLISFAFGMVAYIFFLRADISDLKRENEDLKKNAKKK